MPYPAGTHSPSSSAPPPAAATPAANPAAAATATAALPHLEWHAHVREDRPWPLACGQPLEDLRHVRLQYIKVGQAVFISIGPVTGTGGPQALAQQQQQQHEEGASLLLTSRPPSPNPTCTLRSHLAQEEAGMAPTQWPHTVRMVKPFDSNGIGHCCRCTFTCKCAQHTHTHTHTRTRAHTFTHTYIPTHKRPTSSSSRVSPPSSTSDMRSAQ